MHPISDSLSWYCYSNNLRRLTRRSLGPHAHAQKQSTAKQLLPGVAKGTGKNWPKAKVCGYKNGTTTTNVRVDGIREPGSGQSGPNVGGSIDESNNQLVMNARAIDAKHVWKDEICAVGASLIPSLDRSPD